MKASEVVAEILRRGGRKLRQKGSHARYECACGTNKTTVPIHPGELGRGLLGAIEKDLEPCFGKRWLLGK
ncbi:MAG: type II toxin-antitoxin system HicA family toxin [Myxococcales bacterium]|nr:type II toxin-antitoxin system HicA family toxin [Myxococcales bacterium]MBL0197349.1 type II toxin-antitoxin system HicA family toxin [Myxococcales bacterium]